MKTTISPAIFAAVNPESRACGIAHSANTSCRKSYCCTICGAGGPSFSAKWPETARSIAWRAGHECPASIVARYTRLAKTPAGRLVVALDKAIAARRAVAAGYRYLAPRAVLTVEERAWRAAAGEWLRAAYRRSRAASIAARKRAAAKVAA